MFQSQFLGVKTSQEPRKDKYREFCLNGGCCHLQIEDNIGCNSSWYYEGKRCKKIKRFL